MDTTTVIIATLTAISVIGLAWIGGYRLGLSSGTEAERHLADRRMNGLLDSINQRKPKTQKNKRKASRKGSSGGALW